MGKINTLVFAGGAVHDWKGCSGAIIDYTIATGGIRDYESRGRP